MRRSDALHNQTIARHPNQINPMSPFPTAGGSVLVCWKFDDAPHGYIRQFHLAPSVIAQQLGQMFANGQRRLGLAVPYYPAGDTFALDSTTGRLALQDRANLMALIQLAKSIGFVELLVEMIPEWSAAYTNWQNPAVMGAETPRVFQPLDYDRDFEFTVDVEALVAAQGIPYRMDLIGEGADVEVCARFWGDWCDEKEGHGGSVGFSMVPVQASIDQYGKIYANGIVPEVLSVHAYNNTPAEMDWNQWKQATAAWPQAYIIGESLCDSPAADAIFAASPDRYFYRLVWPLDSNSAAATQNCLTVNQQFP